MQCPMLEDIARTTWKLSPENNLLFLQVGLFRFTIAFYYSKFQIFSAEKTSVSAYDTVALIYLEMIS